MNLTEYSLTRKTVSYLFMVLLIGGGAIAFDELGRLEDPEFTIKDAVVSTPYPGATPLEVEEEVTDLIETAAQQLAQIKEITSESKEGVSLVTVTIKDKYDKYSLPQVWDELRRKINDVQGQLPPGAGPSIVNDDYGDVYGILFAIYGDGYTYAELKEYVDFVRKELLLVPEVAKVVIQGEQQEVIYVETSTEKLSSLGISREHLVDTLKSQNLVTKSGKVRVGQEYIAIEPTGLFKSVKQIENLLIQNVVKETGTVQIYLKDVATVTRGYEDPAKARISFNGKAALGLGVSTISGGNVVRMGEAVKARLEELKKRIPLGVEFGTISFQADAVTVAINGFISSLLQALAIVIAVLFLFMGWRSCMLIALVLLFTIMGTFIFMYMWGVNLERISLGALIIALGMLVDNAIVVTEGVLISVQKGEEAGSAAKKIVAQTQWPLFGATLVAILAFSGIGLSQDNTGEYCRSLFQVILISLLLSWVVAITITPFLCTLFFKPKKVKEGDSEEDPYAGFVYQGYKNFLRYCLNIRWLICFMAVGLLVVSCIGFGYVKQSFFPDSTRPQFYIDYWLPEGMHIDTTYKDVQEISKYIKSLDEVTSVASFTGEGALRFMLTYSPEKNNPSYGFILISVKDYRKIDELFKTLGEYLKEKYPQAQPEFRKIALGTGGGSTIIARIMGEDPKILRGISEKIKSIMRSNPNAKNIKDDWRNPVLKVRPIYNDKKAQAASITRTDLSNSLQSFFVGRAIGQYREEDLILPIVGRSAEDERRDINSINNINIWSPSIQENVPIRQVVDGFGTFWDNSIVHRFNRKRAVEVMGDQKEGTADALLKELMPIVEEIEMPPGYEFEWRGEYGDSKDAKAGLVTGLVFSFLLMIIIVIILFNAIKQSFIIFVILPLAIIGVTAGLLLTNQPFGFMALLGLLSLSGMIIKNAIVLIDQIDLEISEGKEVFAAILDSSVSRMRPVMMAAITTTLGMIPLLLDAFFVSMAVTIMFGLTFATILTLVVVPVLYGILFRAQE